MALRPRSSARSISCRYGSQALALGARPGRGTAARSVDTSALVAGFDRSESVDTSPEIAGFDPPESVDTSGVVAGFAGPGSVDTPGVAAGFGGPGPVDTPGVVAGFGGHTPGRRHARAPGFRPPSGRRLPSPGGPWWPARYAAATNPVARARELAAVCYRPRRCSWQRENMRSSPASTSRLLGVVAGFQVSISGRFWVSAEAIWAISGRSIGKEVWLNV
jgi:hypothetical protein